MECRRSRQDEEGLVVSAQAGNLAAFDVLARRYRPALIATARQNVDLAMAEDVAQDTLLAAFKALPSLEDPSKFGAWLGAIGRRRTIRNVVTNRPTAPLDELIVAYAPGIVERIEANERSMRLRQAIDRLSPDVRVPLELYYGQDWQVSQICEFMGLPETTVKWRLHTGRRLLKQSLGPMLEE